MELENLKYKIMSNELKNEITLSKKQNEAYNIMANGENLFLTGAAGSGKCLGKDTPIIMYDGTVKMIQDIKEGEQVMGDDSTPRNVVSTTFGQDKMYEIKTETGDNYVVNSCHILTFQISKTIEFNTSLDTYDLKWGNTSGSIETKHFETEEDAQHYSDQLPILVDLPILECIEKNKTVEWQDYFQGVYKDIDFHEKYVEMDSYILGLLLAKGLDNDKKTENTFIKFFQNYNLINNKHIPHVYKTNTRSVRLNLLAGLIDGDCRVNWGTYELTQTSKKFSDDIYFLAKSLGFHVKIYERKHIVTGVYYLIVISGNVSTIPVLCPTKKISHVNEIDTTMTSKITITEIGVDTYYGFELDGNHRFLLGNFLVTHNTACIKLFIKAYKPTKIMGVTSTTGISALLFGGVTLHSFLGIGLGHGSVESLYQKIVSRPYLKRRWRELEVLIIDEISMLSPQLFDKLEALARRVRRNEKPFGGIQLILSGDFLQLPCIDSDNFCFESDSWSKCVDNIVYLSEVMRQKDVDFQECLNNIRVGLIPNKTRKLLNSRIGVELKNEFGIKPTKLYSTNYSVDYINNKELDILAQNDPDFYEYKMEINACPGVKNKSYVIDKYKKCCNAPELLQLCVGAQVMLLWNMDSDGGLVNGSRGVVTNFINDVPVVKFLNGRELPIDYHVWESEENGQPVLRVIQMPLKLAYALTIHKSQGCSLDYAEIDLSNTFADGMAYVALSRIKNLDGLNIIEINYDQIKANAKAVEFYKKMEV